MSTLEYKRPVVDVASLFAIENGINKKRMELLETKRGYGRHVIEILVDAVGQLVHEENQCEVHCLEIPGENNFVAYEVLPGVFFSREMSYRPKAKGILLVDDLDAVENDPSSEDPRVWVLPVLTITPDRIQWVLNKLYETHFPDEVIPQFHRRR